MRLLFLAIVYLTCTTFSVFAQKNIPDNNLSLAYKMVELGKKEEKKYHFLKAGEAFKSASLIFRQN